MSWQTSDKPLNENVKTSSSGTLMVLLHGFTGSPESWLDVLSCAPDSARLLVPGLIGHCPQLALADVQTYDQEVERLNRLVAGVANGPVHLVGYSMGARVALSMLVAMPNLYGRATLIGARAGLESAADRARRVAQDAHWIEMLETAGLDAFCQAWEAQPLFDSQRGVSHERRYAQQQVREGHSAQALAHALRVLGLGAMPPLHAQLPTLHVPVHLVVGSLDTPFVSEAELLCRLLPDATLQRVPDCGHNVVLERPEVVGRALFWRELL